MADNNSKVFVGRLPDGCTEKDLETLFTTYGAVNQIDLIGKYGFVHMSKREEAESAINKLNNYNFMGSQLTVQFSTSKMNGGTGKMKSFGGRGRGAKRAVGPYTRNNAFPPTRPPMNRFGGPPVPPNNYGQPYYDDMNGYYREPYSYPEPDPYFRPNNRSGPPYEAPFSRRGPPPVTDFPRAPAPPVQPDYYGRRDVPYGRGLPYDRPVPPPIDQPPPPPPPPALGFGAAPARNGYGAAAFASRGPPAAPVPPPPAAAAARWPPY